MASLHFLSLLCSAVLLSSGISVFGAFEDTTEAPVAPKCGLPPAELEQLVKELNAQRKEVAEKEQIANMHEIRYDPELEKKAASCNPKRDIGCSDGDTASPETRKVKTRVYAYGPNLPMKPEEEIKKGPPSSECPNGKTESGLCKASWHVDPPPLASAPLAPSITEEPNHGGKVSYLISTFILLGFLV